MDFSRALRLITDDTDSDRWTKILIGGLVTLFSFLLLPAVIVVGYQVEVMRRATRGEDRLPAWDDWGGLFVRGLMAIVINLIYALPVILLACCIAAASATANVDPGRPNDVSGAMSAFLVCLTCLAIPFGLFAALVGPVATYRYATTGDVASAFNFGAVFGLLRERFGQYIVAWLVNIVLGLVAAALSSVLCGIPAPWLGFLAGVIGYHLYGQVLSGQAPATTPTYGGDIPPALGPASF